MRPCGRLLRDADLRSACRTVPRARGVRPEPFLPPQSGPLLSLETSPPRGCLVATAAGMTMVLTLPPSATAHPRFPAAATAAVAAAAVGRQLWFIGAISDGGSCHTEEKRAARHAPATNAQLKNPGVKQ